MPSHKKNLMPKKPAFPNEIRFLRQKDYGFEKQLGKGSCGETVLLYDSIIDEKFVCKKYVPYDETCREELFKKFIQEIKILHLIFHENIVRVFNYYIYENARTGYILMEFIDGLDFFSYLKAKPEKISDIFLQAVNGFTYLEDSGILHRDIRPQNILISEDDCLKIIDFGFGKQISAQQDFDKSISLNWWCELPEDFRDETYNFKTEIYFVGKLFQTAIEDLRIEYFQYKKILTEMCQKDPSIRVSSFKEIRQSILDDRFLEIDFSAVQKANYRRFSSGLTSTLSKVSENAVYNTDANDVLDKLEKFYAKVMLEEYIPYNGALGRCFINGEFYFDKNSRFAVSSVKEFINLLRACSKEKRNVILSNLHSRFETLPTYSYPSGFEFDEIPF